MALRSNGAFVVFGGPEGDYTNAPDRDAFLDEGRRPAQDLIVTRSGETIPAEITKDSPKLLTYNVRVDGQTVEQISPREQLMALLHRNGQHELLATPTEVAAAMRKAAQKNSNGTTAIRNLAPAPAEQKAEGGDFTTVEFEAYKNKALLKTDELSGYLATIANPRNSSEEANKAIDLAAGLFVNEDAIFEVSNAYTKEKNKYKVRNYLRKLKLLGEQYSDVKITWTDISYVSNLKKGADGNYYGIVTVQQVFEGFSDGKLVYRDVTRKNVEVVLKTYEKVQAGESKELWDVFLANVGVVETKKG